MIRLRCKIKSSECVFRSVVPSGIGASQANPSLLEFEALAMPLLGSAYSLARWLERNDQAAEDLVQETYLKAFRSFVSFEPGTNFRAWMFRILRNTFYSSRTSLEWRMTVQLCGDEESPCLRTAIPDPESLVIVRSSAAAIRHAIERLPVTHREVMLLCDVEGLSYREIAEELQIPMGTVMSRLARAREVVRGTFLIARIKEHQRPGPSGGHVLSREQ